MAICNFHSCHKMIKCFFNIALHCSFRVLVEVARREDADAVLSHKTGDQQPCMYFLYPLHP